MKPPELETSCLAAVASLAAVDVERARVQLDAAAVQAQDFANPHLRAVWAVVETMVREGRAPDFFAVQARVPTVPRELLTEVLLNGSSQPAGERLRLVKDSGRRRRASAALDTAKVLLNDSTREIGVTLAEARKSLDALLDGTMAVQALDAELFALIDHLAEVAAGARLPTLETGLSGLDAVVGGLQPTLTILGALPGVGKSALLAAVVRNLARRGVRVGFFSLEDEKQWLVRRMVAEAAGIPLFVLANRPLSASQRERLDEAAPRVHNDLAHVFVDDRPAIGVAEIVSSAREMLTRHRVQALFVDHLGEIRLSRTDRHDLDIADALQQLRALAKVYRVPVVVACHVRRREGLLPKDEPRLTDFAFSAAVERMARVALALSRPEEGGLRVHVLKQTQGKAGVTVDLVMNEAAGMVANERNSSARRAQDSFYETQEREMEANHGWR